MSIKRIHTAYKKFNKLIGCSTLLRGHVISKADAACDIMGSTEQLRVAATNVLDSELLQEYHWSVCKGIDIDRDSLIYLVRWLEEHSISLGAYVFNKGNTDRYYFPKELLKFLKDKREYYISEFSSLTNSEQKEGMNFPITNDRELKIIECLRITIRKLEADYVHWLTDSRVILDVLTHIESGIPEFAEEDILPEKVEGDLSNCLTRIGRMIRTYHILNSLSNYFYWYTQFVWVRLYGDKEIRQWENTHELVFDPIIPY